MFKQLKSYLMTIPEKQRRIKSASICFLGDIIIIIYLYQTISSPLFFQKIMTRVKSQYQDYYIPDHFHLHLQELMMQSLIIMCVLIIIIHSIVYSLYIVKNMKSTKRYIKFMSFLGAPFFALTGLMSLNMGIIWFLLILQGLLYLYSAINIKSLETTEKKES